MRTDVYNHGEKWHGKVSTDDWEVKVLSRERDEFRRRAEESLWIGKREGCINRSVGLLVF